MYLPEHSRNPGFGRGEGTKPERERQSQSGKQSNKKNNKEKWCPLHDAQNGVLARPLERFVQTSSSFLLDNSQLVVSFQSQWQWFRISFVRRSTHGFPEVVQKHKLSAHSLNCCCFQDEVQEQSTHNKHVTHCFLR